VVYGFISNSYASYLLTYGTSKYQFFFTYSVYSTNEYCYL